MLILDINKKELKVLMDCVTITDRSIGNNVLMIPIEAKERLEKFNLNDLWVKLYKEFGKL